MRQSRQVTTYGSAHWANTRDVERAGLYRPAGVMLDRYRDHYANVRQPLVHSLNLAHLMPLSAVWAGPHGNRYLAGPPLFQAKTSGSTPFRLSTHVGDVEYMMIVGPTGAGKSVLLSFIALQFRRYAGSRVITFDMGRSARAAVLAMGGSHHAMGVGDGEGGLLPFSGFAASTRKASVAGRPNGWPASAPRNACC